MWTILLLTILAVLATASPISGGSDNHTNPHPTYFLVRDASGQYRKEPLVGKPQRNVELTDVRMFYYSKSMKNGVEVDLSKPDSIKKTDFSNTRETIFIIHGWISDKNTKLNPLIRNAYLAVKDVNIFVVDWSLIARLDYITATASVEPIGKHVGKLALDLVSHSGLNLEKTVFVGHSLGGHIVGVAGRAAGGKSIVIGMDPAGPLFTMLVEENRISKSSGRFVQIIHTNALELGMDFDLGHSDYWPNGGHIQPGCAWDLSGLCSHSRSFEYYAESVKSGKFKAKSCKDWISYESGGCNNGKSSWMGQDVIDKTASGRYYLDTNDHSPFARG